MLQPHPSRHGRFLLSSTSVVCLLYLALARTGEGAPAAHVLGVQPHEAGGVDLVLLEVKRTTGNVLSVKWEYRNKTNLRKQLTNQSTGWVDPYRLALDAYVLDNVNRVKHEVMRDSDQHPIAGRHAGQNERIFVGPKKTLSTWAKFEAPPENIEKVTISIPGAPPFEDVPISK